MKLDKRIKEGKRPLTCFDVEFANQFIGKKGYFSHYIDDYADLKNTALGILGSIEEASRESFVCTEEPFDNYYYEFFLPAEWVKESEKKYRPFKNHKEYKEYLEAGIIESWVKIKEKTSGEVSELMYVGGRGMSICLGSYIFDLQILFDNFELKNEQTKEWQPFGVVDEGE